MPGDKPQSRSQPQSVGGCFQSVSNSPSSTVGSIPAKQCKRMTDLFFSGVDSYNYMLEFGLQYAIEDIPPIEFTEGSDTLRLWISDFMIDSPQRKGDMLDSRLFPHMYGGELHVTYAISVNDGEPMRIEKSMGLFPLMVRSSKCHLYGLNPEELVKVHEEAHENGGYFICNGIERLIRMIQIPRRQYPMALVRPTYRNRGPRYSDKGVTIRCVRPDQSAVSVTLHYLTDGSVTLRFAIRKREFLIPVGVVLRALRNGTEQEIYERILQNQHSNTFLTDRIASLLKENHAMGVFSQTDALNILGQHFRITLGGTEKSNDYDLGQKLIERFVFVHLKRPDQKYELLIVMLRKLYSFVEGKVLPDNADSVMNQDILLPGHLICAFVKDKLEETLLVWRSLMLKDVRESKQDFTSLPYFQRIVKKIGDLGQKLYYFLATGNLITTSGLDLMQVSGYTIVAEKLNWLRYLSHFRSVHRGQYFMEMKTTTVRKLLPESFGFLCPVHTPDGAPCGLLNHLSRDAAISTRPLASSAPGEVLVRLGVQPVTPGIIPLADYLPALYNGEVIGYFDPQKLGTIAGQLRGLKISRQFNLPDVMEIAAIPSYKEGGSTYPGLYLSTEAGRPIRPVKHLPTDAIEQISPLEQVFMEIAISEVDIRTGFTTHIEVTPPSMLSLIASLTPFSDFNQSPRNMYQCQMGKQTMGTPALSLPYRTDGKMYRIQTPQAPIVQNDSQKLYEMDDYPNGTNAVVAVVAYTGYDLEDGMIINQASFQRGFGHGSVYKTHIIDLDDGHKRSKNASHFAKPDPKTLPIEDRQNKSIQALDIDGLPPVGLQVNQNDALYSCIDELTGKAKVRPLSLLTHQIGKHTSSEPAIVEDVRVLDGSAGPHITKVSIKMRYNRNPVVGDKFSSRHGQKGVLSVLWPQIDMPFTESGISPDVIINPHAFPSRMTIGMLIEAMAGKAGAMHGIYQDGTPFRFSEKHRAVDYFGEQLRKAGYSYYGSEPMYSGTMGTEMIADIYIGVVYYQRLRHMVSDKSQARAMGPINSLTQQPVKGRKKHGGIRFGEMERDSLISHGTAFLLHDRLLNVSDRHETYLCRQCGSLLSPTCVPNVVDTAGLGEQRLLEVMCRVCQEKNTCVKVAIPFVFRYLVNELCGVNIKLRMDPKEI